MSIRKFIQEKVFETRLEKQQIMVVYDPERRYRDICRAMATSTRSVVDSSDSGANE